MEALPRRRPGQTETGLARFGLIDEWASAQAANYVLAENDWRDSIRSQGVMEAIWLVATTYLHADGAAPVTVVNTAEGSSRATATHNILDVRSSDVPYEDPDAKLANVARTYRPIRGRASFAQHRHQDTNENGNHANYN